MSVKAATKSKAPAKAKAPVKAKAARKPSPKKAAVKKVTATKKVKASAPKFAAKTASAKPIKGVDAPAETVVVAAVGKGKRVAPKSVAPAAAPVAAAMPVIQQARVPEHTMARSYVRSTGAGKGKLRSGGKFQCTVSFTPDQMAMIVAAAQFRNVSLAELIRSHVVQNLTPVPMGDTSEG